MSVPFSCRVDLSCTQSRWVKGQRQLLRFARALFAIGKDCFRGDGKRLRFDLRAILAGRVGADLNLARRQRVELCEAG